MKSCPNCMLIGSIPKYFGYRKKPEGIRPQSWCITCRNG